VIAPHRGQNAPSFEESSGANTEALWQQGWHGLLLDGTRSNASINLHQSFISSVNIRDTFKAHRVPRSFDYLSVDIDSADLWVLQSILSHYSPRVFTVEYNSNYDFQLDGPFSAALTFPDPATMRIYNERASWSGTCYFGASAKALHAVATARGYSLVGVEPKLDLFYVRTELWTTEAAAIARQAKPSPREKSSPFVPRLPAGLLRADEAPAARLYPSWNHQPMFVEEAVNMMDYEVYARTRSVCAARKAAVRALRAYAELHHKRHPKHEPTSCENFMNDPASCCFKNLRQLAEPECQEGEEAAFGKQQIGHLDG